MFDHIPTRSRPRRSYTRAFKLGVVAETREPGVSVAGVARRHGMNANVVFHWLRDPRFNGESRPAASRVPEAALNHACPTTSSA
jgi:transposase-like protein